MLTIYGSLRSRTTRPMWLVYELGIPFKRITVVPVHQASKPEAAGLLHTRSPEFLKINPNARVPSIEDDGVVLYESMAINLYLARKHGGPLAPANLAEDGLMTMWSLWAATEVEPHSINIVYHRVANPKGPMDPRIADQAIESLHAPFAVLDKALAKNGFLVGGRFTVADINVSEIVRYAGPAPELFDAYPKVKAWHEACKDRPAFKKMWAEREAEPA
jgi:glutathione S-transferase